MDWIFWLPTLTGHIGIWCAVFNRTHATAWPRPWRKLIELAIVAVVGIPILLVPILLWRAGDVSFINFLQRHLLVAPYLVLSILGAVFFLVTWVWRISHYEPPRAWLKLDDEYLEAEKVLRMTLTHGALAKVLSWIPGNQATHLSLEKYRIRLPKLPQGVSIKICQLSDFHFTGQLDIAYFRLIIERVNDWRPDLVVITGDLVDELHCLDWIGPVFEPLQAGCGKFYLLGNHDRRIPSEEDLRSRLASAGLVRAGGRWHTVTVNGVTLHLAGNELPWFKGAEWLPNIETNADDLRIMLTHSPDQIDWADRYGFDIIFAGHTHGGQIRLPVVGPIVSPSKYGVKYAGGAFQVGTAVMHVSRGLCGDEPIRWNCPPEVGFFTIEGPAGEND
jgi:uncharacterized protein